MTDEDGHVWEAADSAVSQTLTRQLRSAYRREVEDPRLEPEALVYLQELAETGRLRQHAVPMGDLRHPEAITAAVSAIWNF
ncbi:hypothetical protein [Thiomonas sp.]